ncbi:hypothetical protein OH492_24790 [Vibrio chagasii]|nr:hypothetical protein [Vibrio chagasii]
MAALYINGMAVVVIGSNLDQRSWPTFSAIFWGAFTGEGVVGGFIGALIQEQACNLLRQGRW